MESAFYKELWRTIGENVVMLDFERMLKEEPEVVEEMKKLRDYLNKHKIEWEDVSEKGFPICRTHFMWGG